MLILRHMDRGERDATRISDLALLDFMRGFCRKSPRSATSYSIRDRDIVVDDEGYRYSIAAASWTVFGYQLNCIRLEA